MFAAYAAPSQVYNLLRGLMAAFFLPFFSILKLAQSALGSDV